jgi:hypothetical protein
MKKFSLSALMMLPFTGAAFAGGLVEPAMEPEVVATATRSSSAGILIPLLILILIAAAVASGGKNSTPSPEELY